MLFEGLFTLLSGEATIQAFVLRTPRKDKTTGIYAGRIDEAADMPAIAFSELRGEGMANSLSGPDQLQQSRLTISCFGKTYSDAKKLARAVRVFLEAVPNPTTLSDGTILASALRINEADTPLEGSDLFHTAQDFQVQYTDSGT